MAAGGREIRAGGAAVYMRLDKTAFAKGLKSAAGELKEFGGSIRNIGAGMAAAGGALGGALFAATKVFANTGDELRDLALRTGMTVEALSELKFAAGQAGAGLEDIEVGAKGMNKFLATAADGSKTATDTLTDLGLTLGQLQSLNPDQKFTKLADAIATVTDPSKRAALAMEVFGKSGTKLLPLFLEGTDKARDLAKAMGLTFTKEDADRADAFNDALGALTATARAAVEQIGSALAGGLQGVIEKLTSATTEVVKFIKAHNELVVAAAKAAVALISVGTAIAGIGIAIQAVGFAMGGFASLLGTIGQAGNALAVFGRIASVVATPAGLLVTAITLLAGAISLVTSNSAEMRAEQEKQKKLLAEMAKSERLHAGAATGDFAEGVAKSLAIQTEKVRGLNKELSKTKDLMDDMRGIPMTIEEFNQSMIDIGKGNQLVGTPAGVDVEPAVSPGFLEFLRRGASEVEEGSDALDRGAGSVAGTFDASASGLLGIQQGGIAKDMLAEAKEGNELLGDINDKLKNNVFRFAP